MKQLEKLTEILLLTLPLHKIEEAVFRMRVSSTKFKTYKDIADSLEISHSKFYGLLRIYNIEHKDPKKSRPRSGRKSTKKK